MEAGPLSWALAPAVLGSCELDSVTRPAVVRGSLAQQPSLALDACGGPTHTPSARPARASLGGGRAGGQLAWAGRPWLPGTAAHNLQLPTPSLPRASRDLQPPTKERLGPWLKVAVAVEPWQS